jgi:multicomponent Na+:H+ antiporter subunit F
MIAVTNLAAFFLLVAAAGSVYRVVRGPSVADRMVALDTLLFVGVAGIGTFIVRTGDTTYVPVLVVAVLTAFVSTVVVARYIEAETRR